MVPHIVFQAPADGYFPGPDVWKVAHVPPTSGITQPPILATMVRAVYAADRAAGLESLKRVFQPLLRWHRWFMRFRLERGMIAITHPWESGRDNAVDWDGAMAGVDVSGVGDYQRNDTHHVDPDMRPSKADYDRYLAILYYSRDSGWNEAKIAIDGPFRVADVGMTFTLLRACRDLLAIARELGQDRDEIEGWVDTLEQGAANHWNDAAGHYDSYDLRRDEFAGSLSSASFLSWYAGVPGDRMLAHYDRVMGEADFGVPSNDPEAPTFAALRYWRGPVWASFNALIALGLREMHHEARARALRQNTRRLIAEHGFYEYFSPIGGAPAGGPQFTWTAAIWLAWASSRAQGRA